MSMFPSRTQWKRYALPTKMTLIGAFVSVISLAISSISLMYQPTSATDIQSKIRELDSIQSALVTLNIYVGNQHKALRSISEQKSSLEAEKNRVQTALQIDKEKLDALLEYQLTQQKKGNWLELLISFFVGVLSSSVVTFAAIKYQSKKQATNEV